MEVMMSSLVKRATGSGSLIVTTVMVLLIVQLLPLTKAEDLPDCICSDTDCMVSVNNTERWSMEYSYYNCKNSTNTTICCTDSAGSTGSNITLSGCGIRFVPNRTELDSQCGIVNQTCTNQTSSLSCSRAMLLNGTCLASCPCGYELDGQTSCKLASMTTTSTKTMSTEPGTSSLKPEDCDRPLVFPIFASDSNGVECKPNLNFWLLVTITPAVSLILLVVVIVLLCKKCRRVTPNHNHNTAPPDREAIGLKIQSTKKPKGPQRVPTKPNDYVPKQSNQGPQVEPVSDYEAINVPFRQQPQVQTTDETQEDYENVPKGLVAQNPGTLRTARPDEEQEVYENVQSPPAGDDDQEIYENEATPGSEKLLGRDYQPTTNRESQELYLPMDGSHLQADSATKSQNPGYANMSGNNDLVSQLQKIVSRRGKTGDPSVTERPESQEEYVYADQQALGQTRPMSHPQTCPDSDPQETYDDIPQGNDLYDDGNIYQNVRNHPR